jgi:hypothetical protein
MASPVEIYAEMGTTHRAFFRTLVNAVEGRPYTVTGQHILIKDGDRTIEVDLSDEWRRHIATISMPVTNVTWRFIGHTQAEAEAIKGRFDIFFRRGGG